MALLTGDAVPRLYDFALNGVGYLVAWELDRELLSPWKAAYLETAVDMRVEKRDVASEEMSENKLDYSFWKSQRDWTDGAGQDRFDAPKSSHNAFSQSRGMNVTVPGQATILPSTSLLVALPNVDPVPQKMVATDQAVFAAAAQPNLKKFSATDASDVSNVSTGTETAQPVFDMATDGGQVYVALGADGTHVLQSPFNTQLESFDTTTGWSVTSGSATITSDTTGQKEGAGALSIRFPSNPATIAKTEGPWDFTTADQVSFWYTCAAGANYQIRLVTSPGNYYFRTLSSSLPLGWTNDVSAKSAWTAVGSPNWASIATVNIVANSATNIEFDDLRSLQSGSSFSHFSDWDCRVLGWAKDRLYGGGIKTGSTWRFFEVGSLATSTEWLALPASWTITCIGELGGFVYFAATRGNRGLIYAFDGTNPPFAAAPLPLGDIPLSLTPFLGAGFLVGCRRVNTATTSGQGVLYRAFPLATGHLTLERVLTVGTQGDGKDYGIRCGFAASDMVRYGWSYAGPPDTLTNPQVDTTTTGLGVYNPQTGGYSRWKHAVAQGVVMSACLFKGLEYFTIDGQGVYGESNSGALVADPFLIGSLMDWNIDALKLLLNAQVGFKSLPAGGSVIVDYSTDEGTTWSSLITDTTAGDKKTGAPIRVTAQDAQYRVRVTPGSGNANVTLKKAGISAIYGEKPRRDYKIAVKAYSQMSLKNGTPHPQSGPGLPHAVVSGIQALHDSQTIVQFQPIGYGEEHTDVVDVRVASLETHRTWVEGSGWSINCKIELLEVPA